jgi:DUF4097 and DUF4098 domain-containing protein YvlB
MEGGLVRVRPGSIPGRAAAYTVTVPTWLPLTISANQSDIVLRGVGGEVSVTTVQGNVEITGGAGRLSARSVQGRATLTGARGPLEARSVNADARLFDSNGQIQIESVHGDNTIERSETQDLVAVSNNGDIVFSGPIQSGGRYRLSSHNGDVRLSVQAGANATFSLQTYQGQVRSAFPVALNGMGADRRFTFVLGDGSARVEAASFNGNIEMARP